MSYGDSPLPDTRIEDGKLLFERRWYHRGQPVYVEGKDINTYPALITAIGTESVSIRLNRIITHYLLLLSKILFQISVKKTLDGAKFKINLYQLVRGTYSVKRRAP
jgi:Sin3 histone deacetylase corepressor complex component SDS3